jgi:hypothetical protein
MEARIEKDYPPRIDKEKAQKWGNGGNSHCSLFNSHLPIMEGGFFSLPQLTNDY